MPDDPGCLLQLVSKIVQGVREFIYIICIVVIQKACSRSPPRAQRCVIYAGCSLSVVGIFNADDTFLAKCSHSPIHEELKKCMQLKLLRLQQAGLMCAERKPWLPAAIPCPASPSHIQSLHPIQETPSSSSRISAPAGSIQLMHESQRFPRDGSRSVKLGCPLQEANSALAVSIFNSVHMNVSLRNYRCCNHLCHSLRRIHFLGPLHDGVPSAMHK